MQSKRPVKEIEGVLHLKCNKCFNFFTLDKFSKSKKDKLWKVSYECKVCRNKEKTQYCLTKKGVIQTIWDSQLSSCKKRKCEPPKYNKEQFKAWILGQEELFDTLYNTWVDSEYKQELKPSVDRLDNFETYSLDNIRLTTWGDNKELGHLEHRKAKLPNQIYCPVYQIKDGEIVGEFISMSEVERVLGIPQGNVWKVCNGERHTAGGFGWIHKNETK